MQQMDKARIIDFPSPKDPWAEYWQIIIGTPLTPQASALLRWWEMELSAKDVYYAIDETALAPKPSIRYTIAILRRLAAERGQQ